MGLRKEIDSKILEGIKQEIISFLATKNGINLDKAKRNMAGYNLYVENLWEKTQQQRMAHRKTEMEIVIDKQFVVFNNDGNPIGLDVSLEKLIHSQIGHELLHAAGKYDRGTGIKKLSNDEFAQNIGLNEGFTQLITEEIFGYTVSPNADNYTDYKKVAQIFQLTFGENVILNSYFNQSNDLENSCNNLAQSNRFYISLNRALTQMYSFHKYKDPESRNLYGKMNELVFQSICINTVIPHLKSLNKAEQTQYLTDILESVKDQPIIGQQIIDTIKKSFKLNMEGRKQQKSDIDRQLAKIGVKGEERVNNPPEQATQIGYRSISFKELQEYLEHYELDYALDTNNQWKMIVKDRVTGAQVEDTNTQIIAQFAEIWREAAGIKYMYDEKISGQTYAFNEGSELVFNQISNLINQSMSESGRIDTKSIIEEISKGSYKYANSIVTSLFANQVKIKMLYDFYSIQNPQAKLETELPQTSTEILRESGKTNPFNFDYNSDYIKMQVGEITDLISQSEKQEKNQSHNSKTDETWAKRLDMVKKIMDMYDLTEEDYQYEKRTQMEGLNEDAVRKILQPIEIEGKSIHVIPKPINNLLTDRITYLSDGKSDEQSSKYTSKATSEMINLLKAADNLSIDGGRNYLLELIKVPDIEYKLGQMINGDTKLIEQLKGKAEENERNGKTAPSHPKTKGELAKETRIKMAQTRTSGRGTENQSPNFKTTLKSAIREAGIDIGEVYGITDKIQKDMQQDRGTGMDK